MSNFIQLKSRLFNEPLLLEPSYAQVLFGAIADKLHIESFINGQEKLSIEDLKESAASFGIDRTNNKPYAVNNGVAMIPVSGSLVAKSSSLRPYSGMTGYNGIKTNLDMALDDSDVKSILFEMDSSGGEVTGCFDLADYIYGKRGAKKMTAIVSSLACSACYALASACDEIVMSETATVGSIGVITAHTSVEKAMNDRGVEVTLIHAGKHKADGNPYKKLPTEVRERIQSRLDGIHTMFAERVAKYRGISVESVYNTEALTYQGQDAIDVGLADGIVSVIDYIENLSQTGGSNINLESQDMTNEEHEQALTTAKAASFASGGEAMQTRIKDIMTSEHADGRNDLAEHLAYGTEMSAEDATTMLSKAPKESATPAAVETPQAQGADFKAAMTAHSAEDVGVLDTDANAADDEDELSAFLTHIGK